MSDIRRKSLLQDFKAFYQDASPASFDKLDRLYTQDVEFRDPLHTLHGILAFKSYLKSVYASSSAVHFDYLEEHSGEHWASITWLMTYSHGSLGGGRPLQLRGTTQIRFSDRIFYQEDFFDVGTMVYQHVPVLGPVIRFINRRICR